jgi:hypothetical protein
MRHDRRTDQNKGLAAAVARFRASSATAAALLLAALAAVALLAGGCGRPAQRIAKSGSTHCCPRILWPADHYSTRVRDSTSGLLRGRLRSIHVDGVNVRMSDDLTVDRLALDVRDASVNTRTQRLNRIGSVTFAATIGEANLNRYVRALRPDIENLSVRLRAGEAILQAKPDVADLFGLPVSLRGTLRPRAGGDGTQLDFVPGGARVAWCRFPAPSYASSASVSTRSLI